MGKEAVNRNKSEEFYRPQFSFKHLRFTRLRPIFYNGLLLGLLLHGMVCCHISHFLQRITALITPCTHGFLIVQLTLSLHLRLCPTCNTKRARVVLVLLSLLLIMDSGICQVCVTGFVKYISKPHHHGNKLNYSFVSSFTVTPPPNSMLETGLGNRCWKKKVRTDAKESCSTL